MRKAGTILLTMILVISLCACEKMSGSSDKTFAARISLATERSLTVTPDVTTHEYKSADTVIAALKSDTVLTDAEGNAIELSFLTTGTEVEITYDGTLEESYPARITAKIVRLRNGVARGTAPKKKKNTVTFTLEGGKETVAADKVALGRFSILVPSDGWKSSSAENTEVGPLIISPQNDDNVSLTFRVHRKTDIKDVQAMFLREYAGFSWEIWDEAENKFAMYTASETSGSVYIAAFTTQFGEDTVSILCRCPEDMVEGYGARLTQIAATLAISP